MSVEPPNNRFHRTPGAAISFGEVYSVSMI